TEEMDQPVTGDGFGTEVSRSIERLALAVEQVLKTSQCFLVKSLGSRQGWSWHGLFVVAERVLRENPLSNRFSFNQVLLHELGNAFRRHAVIPGSFGINDHGRAMAADAQATDFGAITGIRTGSESVIFDLLLEHFPGSKPRFRRTAAGPRAKKDMLMIAADA